VRQPLQTHRPSARQQDSETGKLDGPVSQEAAVAPGRRHEQDALKDGPSADQPESSQGRIGPRSESSADDKAKPNMKKSPKEVAVEQNRLLEKKVEIRTGARTSSRRSPNRTIRFLQLHDRRNPRVLLRSGRLQHLFGVLQASRPARGGGSSR
jgi:hypothetical protein